MIEQCEEAGNVRHCEERSNLWTVLKPFRIIENRLLQRPRNWREDWHLMFNKESERTSERRKERSEMNHKAGTKYLK